MLGSRRSPSSGDDKNHRPHPKASDDKGNSDPLKYSRKIGYYWTKIKEYSKEKISNVKNFVTDNDKFVVAFSTVIIAIFTVFLVIANIMLYISSEKVAIAAKASADAALIQASAIRANLSYDVFAHPYNKEGQEISVGSPDRTVFWEVNPEFKNIGGTDARNVKGWFNINTIHIDHPVDATHRIVVPCPAPSLPVAAADAISTILTPGEHYVLVAKKLTVDQAIAAGRPYAQDIIFIHGYIEYNDIFDGTPTHHYAWCDIMFPNDISKPPFFSYFDRGRSAD